MATTRKKKGTKLSKEKKFKAAKARIKPVSQATEFYKFCFYGRNGRGKTHVSATGPKKVLIISAERGTSSARDIEGVDVFEVNTWTDVDLAYWYLASGDHEYKTVAIDTVTALATLCMKFVLGDESSRDPTRDPDMPDKRVWGKVGELMKTVIMNFMVLPMHVVFLAQERKSFSEDEDDSAQEVFPALSPAAREVLMQHVNVIGRCYTKGVVKKVKVKGKTKKKVVPSFRILLAHHDIYSTKVNIGGHGLPDVVINPDLSTIIEVLNRTERKSKAKKTTKKKEG